MFKRCLSVLALSALLAAPALAQDVNGVGQPSEVVPSGRTQANITNTTANITNSSTTITLAKACRKVCVKTDPAAAVIYVDFANGTATTADFRIDPGSAYQYEGKPITAFKYIGASVTGTISVIAN